MRKPVGLSEALHLPTREPWPPPGAGGFAPGAQGPARRQEDGARRTVPRLRHLPGFSPAAPTSHASCFSTG